MLPLSLCIEVAFVLDGFTSKKSIHPRPFIEQPSYCAGFSFCADIKQYGTIQLYGIPFRRHSPQSESTLFAAGQKCTNAFVSRRRDMQWKAILSDRTRLSCSLILRYLCFLTGVAIVTDRDDFEGTCVLS